MQAKRVVFLMLLFALAAAGAYAQTCPPVYTCPQSGCPTITTPAAEACPAQACPAMGAGPAEPVCPAAVATEPVCPAPVVTEAQTCPPACVCVEPTPVGSCAISAGFGGGPLNVLTTTPAGANFDRVYLENMYPLSTNIIGLVSMGADKATDKNLRDLSSKIRDELTDQNNKVATWYSQMGCGCLAGDTTVVDSMYPCLCGLPAGEQFDAVYAQTLIDSLGTLRASALTGAPKLMSDEIRYQANLTAKVADNEIIALQRWLNDHGYASGTTYPAAYGAGCGPCAQF